MPTTQQCPYYFSKGQIEDKMINTCAFYELDYFVDDVWREWCVGLGLTILSRSSSHFSKHEKLILIPESNSSNKHITSHFLVMSNRGSDMSTLAIISIFAIIKNNAIFNHVSSTRTHCTRVMKSLYFVQVSKVRDE